MLESLCFQLWLVPSVCGDSAPKLAHDGVVFQVEEAGALGRLQPFMWRRSIKVAAHIVQVEAHHPGDVCSIERRDDALGARQRSNFFYRQNNASNGSDVADKDDARAGSNGVVDSIQYFSSIFRRLGNPECLNHNSIALGPELPRLFSSGMLLIAHQHLVAGFHFQSIGDVVIALSGVSSDGDLIASGADELG